MKVEVRRDAFGDCCVVSVPASVYPLPAVLKTAYWYTDTCYVFVDRSEAGEITVELRLKSDDAETPLWALGGQFYNRVLDFTVRQQVHEETHAVRETLIAAAMREAIPEPTNG